MIGAFGKYLTDENVLLRAGGQELESVLEAATLAYLRVKTSILRNLRRAELNPDFTLIG